MKSRAFFSVRILVSEMGQHSYHLTSCHLTKELLRTCLQYVNVILFGGFLHHHHHHVIQSARVSLTLTQLPFLHCFGQVFSFTYPIGTELLNVAGSPSFIRQREGVYQSTSFISSSILPKQFPACAIHLTSIVFGMGIRWPYSCFFIGCCLIIDVQYCSQLSCVDAVKLFIHSFS